MWIQENCCCESNNTTKVTLYSDITAYPPKESADPRKPHAGVSIYRGLTIIYIKKRNDERIMKHLMRRSRCFVFSIL